VSGLPYRGTFGAPRPATLDGLALPPAAMPSHVGTRPLKAWRYVGVFGSEVMLCAGVVRIGRARQSFWAVWDRQGERLHQRTSLGTRTVAFARNRLRVLDREVQIDLTLEEVPGIEAICPTGASYAWTRKQGGVRAFGTVALDGHPQVLDARAVIDDTAAYYARRTDWRWCAGVGRAIDGRHVAWNLVDGVNDPPANSERTVWLDGEPTEAPPALFAPDLSSVGELRFLKEATRERRENLLLIRSSYRQPFGTFEGALPGGIRLAEGYGVMEEHDAWW